MGVVRLKRAEPHRLEVVSLAILACALPVSQPLPVAPVAGSVGSAVRLQEQRAGVDLWNLGVVAGSRRSVGASAHLLDASAALLGGPDRWRQALLTGSMASCQCPVEIPPAKREMGASRTG